MSEDVLKWMKRLNRKGPFYLVRTEQTTIELYDHSVTPYRKYPAPANVYAVIWNDKEKTKFGYFKDYMSCRYGVSTATVLRGETHFDLWNGQCIDEAEFQEMLKVRNHTTTLPQFDLATLVGLTW